MSETGLKLCADFFQSIISSLDQVIVGQAEVKRFLVLALLNEGHVLIEGLPGLGKTVTVKTLSKLLGLEFRRVQFTPDIMPADILGTEILETTDDGSKKLVFKNGPIFTNFLLADEINRASPKTQSALLEAMEEKQVTVFGQTYPLPRPFYVVATQNPIELEGTYPLPEAQLDRFLIKLIIEPPSEDDLVEVILRETSRAPVEIKPLLETDQVIDILQLAKELLVDIVVPEKLLKVIARITSFLNPAQAASPETVKKYIRNGPGPRGSLALTRMAKAMALVNSRTYVTLDDIRETVIPTLRHRLILSFEAEAEGIDPDSILEEVRNSL